MTLSGKQKSALVIGGIVTATVLAVLAARSGWFGSKVAEATKKLEGKVEAAKPVSDQSGITGSKVTDFKTIESIPSNPLFFSDSDIISMPLNQNFISPCSDIHERLTSRSRDPVTFTSGMGV